MVFKAIQIKCLICLIDLQHQAEKCYMIYIIRYSQTDFMINSICYHGIVPILLLMGLFLHCNFSLNQKLSE